MTLPRKVFLVIATDGEATWILAAFYMRKAADQRADLERLKDGGWLTHTVVRQPVSRAGFR